MPEPRDWDKEMAEIDKLLATGGPPAPSAPALPATRDRAAAPPPAARQAGGAVVTGRKHIAGVWVRALLGMATAVALPFWPYAKGCGTMLYLYLVATFAVIVVGIWTMRYAWTHRRGVAHVAGLLTLLAGLGFAGYQILERSALVATRLAWICP